ncbi:CHASE2 domain-containing protein [Sphingomonas sanxanigenens]|uniref:PPM-type phosphatase domain-containing protein n=1 Tax=Sphingomonas sanxanigenens DSM 19645 = NX02 TaxID=1123269 RepID=W0AG87_9SPHN|nr:CHASE2 domain-containing protein [Sphingomonas sanxanigenens]AHE55298.1 hypothetical protein NX02_18145 [Sphingomonas sanxanigenens DSM 19645 = NX02]
MTGSNSTSDPGIRAGRARLAGIVAGLLVVAASLAPQADALRRPLFDLWQRLMPRDFGDTRVAVVMIDDASIDQIGPWPWSRYAIARLVETIHSRGAAVIGLDMLLSEPDPRDPAGFADFYHELPVPAAEEVRALTSMDRVLAQVIGRSPVVLGRAGIAAEEDKAAPPLAVEAQFTAPLPAGVRAWDRALANIQTIDDVAEGHGLLNGDADADGTQRRVPLVATVAGTPNPGFALELARIASRTQAVTPVVRNGRLRAVEMGGRRLAVDPDGAMRMRFGTLPAHAQFSAASVMGDPAPADQFRNRIVLVGLGGAGSADMVSTPLAPQGYGAAVQAMAVDAILAGDSLSRPGWALWAERVGALALLLLFGGFSPQRRPWRMALLAVAAALATIAISAGAFAGGLLLDPVLPLLSGLAAGAVTVLLLYAEGRRHQAALQRALWAEQLAAAHSAGELTAAREMQQAMLPDAATLAALDPRIEIAGLIEPARDTGGDFYDAIRLDADRLCLFVGDVTGKGMSAALFMALSRALTRSVLSRGVSDLAPALETLNAEIMRDNVEDMFVTMAIALLDCRTGDLAYAGVGHEDPWLVRADGTPTPLRSDGGPPFGAAEGMAYGTSVVRLAPGDTVILLSDGVTEAQDGTGRTFGTAGVAETLRNWSNAGPVNDACRRLHAAVRALEGGGEATDDLTVLAFRYRGDGG